MLQDFEAATRAEDDVELSLADAATKSGAARWLGAIERAVAGLAARPEEAESSTRAMHPRHARQPRVQRTVTPSYFAFVPLIGAPHFLQDVVS